MKTPICDFVRRYSASSPQRLHMPGHKGSGILGVEALDITEVSGADSLYEAGGIIAESEANASRIFGCHTFYSTEGSSQCIRAMLLLALRDAAAKGRRPCVAAGRNAHKTFLTAAALLDIPVRWLCPEEDDSYLSCTVAEAALEEALRGGEVSAVYLTSPDYLGHVADIAALAAICHRYGALLLVDNAHGAYLKFLQPSQHPSDLGADLCCDSAHKTLPVLTGGAYLHVKHDALALQGKEALALFGSTSPSYLILQSLDGANPLLQQEFPEALTAFLPAMEAARQRLREMGWQQESSEPLKLTLRTKPAGYRGEQLAELLRQAGIECEFADPDYLVLMFSPLAGVAPLEAVLLALQRLGTRPALPGKEPAFHRCEAVLTPRQAMLAPSETVSVKACVGRVLASPSVGCPPAVPIVLCGERIDDAAAERFAYYGIEAVSVVKE